jgi:hypothetical protein
VFYQFGVADHIRSELSELQLKKLNVYGASCGAITAVFLKSGVDFERAAQLAQDMADEAGVHDKPLGLVGVWGPILYRWLDELLPEDAHERCSGSVHVQMQNWRGGAEVHKVFATKESLVHAVMASTHIPLVLDGAPFYSIGGRHYVDGYLGLAAPVCDAETCLVGFPDDLMELNSIKMLDIAFVTKMINHGRAKQLAELWAEGRRHNEEEKNCHAGVAHMLKRTTLVTCLSVTMAVKTIASTVSNGLGLSSSLKRKRREDEDHSGAQSTAASRSPSKPSDAAASEPVNSPARTGRVRRTKTSDDEPPTDDRRQTSKTCATTSQALSRKRRKQK